MKAQHGGHMNTVYISLLTYGLLIVGLLKGPESLWDRLLNWQETLSTFYAHKKKNLPFIGEIYHGEDLLLALSETEAKIALGIKILPNAMTRYKFYTDLLEQLLQAHRRLGIGIKKFIPEIRQAIIRDLQFEKKISNECIGAFLQFLVIAATTWSFVLVSSSLVKIPPNKSIMLSMIMLEALGVFAFYQLLTLIKKLTFQKFGHAISEVYLFSTLMEVGLPLNEILTRSQILQGSLMEQKQFSPLALRTKKLIDRLKETGLSPKEESLEIIGGLWHLQEETFQKFTKKVQVLKFGILAFFFLPAYFLYLYSIFKFFMEQ